MNSAREFIFFNCINGGSANFSNPWLFSYHSVYCMDVRTMDVWTSLTVWMEYLSPITQMNSVSNAQRQAVFLRSIADSSGNASWCRCALGKHLCKFPRRGPHNRIIQGGKDLHVSLHSFSRQGLQIHRIVLRSKREDIEHGLWLCLNYHPIHCSHVVGKWTALDLYVLPRLRCTFVFSISWNVQGMAESLYWLNLLS